MPGQPSTPSGKLSDVARHVVVPEGIVSTGWPAVVGKCAELGISFDPWQDGLGRIVFAKRSDGLYATSVGGVTMSIPRQVGKTFFIGAVAFAMCLLKADTTVIWTSHRLRTAGETFRSMQGMARRRRIAPLVKHVFTGSGDEEIQFHNGSRILFGARERGFGRGFSLVDVLVFDEAQILTDNAIDDMVPATNQAPNPLLLFAGTPPKPTDPGEVFTAKRRQALAGELTGAAYVEFSADPHADPNDRKQWSKANASYPHRTPEVAMLRMHANLTEDSFLREGLGIWEDTNTKRVIDETSWASMADVMSVAVDKFALGVDVAPDRSMASVALAGLRADGCWHVELDEQRPGVGWVVPYLARLIEANPQVRSLVIDERAQSAIVDELAKLKIRVTPTTERAMAAACGGFYDGVMDAWLRHTDQPQVNAALGAARKREMLGGNAWGWSRKNSASDITPLVAATLALWGAMASGVKKPTRRGGRSTAGRTAVVL